MPKHKDEDKDDRTPLEQLREEIEAPKSLPEVAAEQWVKRGAAELPLTERVLEALGAFKPNPTPIESWFWGRGKNQWAAPWFLIGLVPSIAIPWALAHQLPKRLTRKYREEQREEMTEEAKIPYYEAVLRDLAARHPEAEKAAMALPQREKRAEGTWTDVLTLGWNALWPGLALAIPVGMAGYTFGKWRAARSSPEAVALRELPGKLEQRYGGLLQRIRRPRVISAEEILAGYPDLVKRLSPAERRRLRALLRQAKQRRKEEGAPEDV